MTVVVAFLCSDGVVVAADSMITPSIGGINVGHHTGLKIDILSGPQIFAFAGDQGQAARFQLLASSNHNMINNAQHPLEYAIFLTQLIIQQFVSTGVNNAINVNTILSYAHGGSAHCCVFEGAMQPRMLDVNHFYVALGSGKLSADPFLKFLVDIFCQQGQPRLREALFLVTWTIQHVIDTNPGGVAGPIRVAVYERDAHSLLSARDLPLNEIEEHRQAIASAGDALRSWRQSIPTGGAAIGVPNPPGAAGP